jgi:hypothetical protein
MRRLRASYLRGELSDETFERRVALAWTAAHGADLRAVGADLPTLRDRLALLVRTVWPTRAAAPPPALRLPLPDVPPGARLTVGRSRRCDLRVDDPTVSRRHAELRRTATGWLLVDVGSTNGTYRHGRRVARTAIASGDDLRLGAAVVRVF